MCICDCLSSVIPNMSYINSVIAGMTVKAAVNQKKREDRKTAQFLLIPVGNSIRYGRHIYNIQYPTYQLQN